MTTDDDDAMMRTSIPKFSGVAADWRAFKLRFLTWATKKGYEEILTGEEDIPKRTYDASGRR